MKQAEKFQPDGNLTDHYLQAMADEYKASAIANPQAAPHLLHLARQAEDIIWVRGQVTLPEPMTITLLGQGQHVARKARTK